MSTSDGDSANNDAGPCPVRDIFHPDVCRPDTFPGPDIWATGPVFGTDALLEDDADTRDTAPDDEMRPGPVAFDP